ncbi:RnfH family protein [Ramlibacter sp. PS4R-6]|uniref:RnfH family protein n=1 Tax=Ramlibacter sp. PS4R-6 TaxID=3133438 RepID=UPI0030B0F15F
MADAPLRVTVVFSPAPREVREWALALAPGSTVADAIAASGLRGDFPALDLDALGVGVWGRKAGPKQPLRDRDRVEVYRPLQVDPKVARRERFRKQGTRAAGLFARKR